MADPPTSLSPPLALVADDDAQMRSLIGTVLRSAGLVVVELNDGLELVDYLRQSTCPALLVTDLQMPGFTGLRAIRYARRLGLQMPIILVTAFGNSRIHVEALRLGAAAVLDKPFSLGALRALATRLLESPEEPSGVRGELPKREQEAG